ncbi:hypothetical protein [Roseibium polysiphoniae]|uniref:MAPEG family protein n=1 Tax=Roseibium polysiphoniae TaxID=2571221 RepID=A0ABR9CF78_9HYPH|nr:hypothetical protein [Roseibium polysiphoniae]MBD8878522.1 hypothetical protein [Roseibium polysiphoniae]
MSTSDAVLIGVGYALFVPLIWIIGNLFTKWVIDRAVDELVPTPKTALPATQEGETSVTPVAAIPSDQHQVQGGRADAEMRELKAGRVIGVLERLLIVTGLVLGKWEVLVAVIALKTVARYQELDTKLNAEYFLIGSLASVLWAVATSVALLLYDQSVGFGLFPAALLK